MELIFQEKKVIKSYDNEGAMQTVKAMMKRGEQLIVRFYTNKENYPCAWIESKKIQGFCLILNQEGLKIGYVLIWKQEKRKTLVLILIVLRLIVKEKIRISNYQFLSN